MAVQTEKQRQEFLTRRETCALLRISRWTLRDLEKNDPLFPVFIPVSQRVAITERAMIDRWLLRRRLRDASKVQR